MKESKAVNVTKQKNYENQNLVYQVCTRNNVEYTDRSNFGCQYDCKKDNMLCTCRNKSSKRAKPQDMVYFSDDPKQIYSYHGSKCFTDILVGRVKALHKRKVKRVYLPETDDRGVGSSDLVSFSSRKYQSMFCSSLFSRNNDELSWLFSSYNKRLNAILIRNTNH